MYLFALRWSNTRFAEICSIIINKIRVSILELFSRSKDVMDLMKDLNQNNILISLLGRFEVSRGGKILSQSDWKRRKASALLQRLALERRLLKEQAIEFLWPESSPKTGANNLYRTIHALRSTLDSALGADTAQSIFAFSDSVLTITDLVWVDAHEFKRLCMSKFSDNRKEIER
jgi:two-component SAPR family response regulator